MRWLSIPLILLAGCAAATTPPADPIEYGATQMRKVDGGYELANRKVRLVIDEKTGDVTYFGAADGKNNLVSSGGITVHLAGQPFTAPDGYIEKRDEQAWQYLGDSAAGIRWRKIYTLENRSVYVTVLAENRTGKSIDTALALRAAFDGGRVVTARADVHERRIGNVMAVFKAFNEAQPQRPDWATLIGDSRTVLAGERISWTMEWRIDGL